jgi:hypothetical protein
MPLNTNLTAGVGVLRAGVQVQVEAETAAQAQTAEG